MRARSVAGAAALLLVMSSCAGDGGDADPGPHDVSPLVVDTTTGTVRGLEVGSTRQYLGIRYAEPPTGERRWTLPTPARDTEEVLDATEPGSPCPQSGDIALSSGSDDEDCLFVNVTVPARSADGPRPMMVWWHGGGFTSGAGSQYDARRLADEGDVVVVTANYRLGMLGYLSLPGLEGSGNFGLADQIAALRWANDNAEAFGADPDNVTVFGESAGGTSVCAALTSPAVGDLVDRAIFSSGSCRLAWPPGTLFPGLPAVSSLIPLADSEALGTTAATALGCTGPGTLACLRRVPVGDLVAQAATFGNPLAYGTDLLPSAPAEAVVAGDVLDVPILAGGNRDEHRSFIGGLLLTEPEAITARSYPDLVHTAFGADAPRVLQRYPLTAYDSAPLAWSTLVTDVAWSCTTARGARELAGAGLPVWTYEFADRTAPDVSRVGSSGLPQGAAHATDLPYLFDLGGRSLLTTDEQRALSAQMVQVWTSFARDGEPTTPDRVDWPPTTLDREHVLRFDDDGAEVADTRAEHQCDFWATVDR